LVRQLKYVECTLAAGVTALWDGWHADRNSICGIDEKLLSSTICDTQSGVHQNSSNIWEQPREIKFQFINIIKTWFQGMLAIHYSVRNLSSFCLLPKNIEINTYVSKFVSFLYGCQTWVCRSEWGM
jgi:hypothetical protein